MTKQQKALKYLEEEIKKTEDKLKRDIKLRDKLTVHQHRDLENCFSRISKYEYKLSQLNTIRQALIQEQYEALEEYMVLEKFSTQETVYTIYGTHRDEIILIDLFLRRIHISRNGDINDCYTLSIDDHKKTWWLEEDRSE